MGSCDSSTSPFGIGACLQPIQPTLMLVSSRRTIGCFCIITGVTYTTLFASASRDAPRASATSLHQLLQWVTCNHHGVPQSPPTVLELTSIDFCHARPLATGGLLSLPTAWRAVPVLQHRQQPQQVMSLLLTSVTLFCDMEWIASFLVIQDVCSCLKLLKHCSKHAASCIA